jgi:hypothetical protein
MKIFLYSVITAFILFFIWQFYSAQSNKKYESLNAEYLGQVGEINFKIFDHYTKASIMLSNGNMNSANNKFSILANYIFGGNKDNAQMEMTSPVIYSMENNASFSFLMPYDRENNLPQPNSEDIFFSSIDNQCVAILTFGGYAKSTKCKNNHQKLHQKLTDLGIDHNNDYIIAVYQPPFQLINRKNEIWIEVNKDQIEKLLDI